MISPPSAPSRHSGLNVVGLAVSAVVASFVADAARAQSTWIGGADTDWNNPTNWSSGVPTASTRVTISPDIDVPDPDPNQPLTLDNQPVLDGGSGAADTFYLGSLAGAVMDIRNGGHLTAVLSDIGRNSGDLDTASNRLSEQSGTLRVAGSTSRFSTDSLTLGFYGTGIVEISDGAALVADGPTAMSVSEGSTSTLSFDGAGTTGTLGSAGIGVSGTATVSVTNGAEVTSQAVTIAQNDTAVATMEVNGSGSSWTLLANNLTLGSRGRGTLEIHDGGTVTAANRVTVGQNSGSIGTMMISGTGSTLASSELVNLGFRSGSTATASVTDGGRLEAVQVLLGWLDGSSGALEASGAETRIMVESYLMAGFQGDGLVTLSDGATLEALSDGATTSLRIAHDSTSSGTVTIGAARGETAVGAGFVTVDSVRFGTGTGELVFNHDSEGYAFDPALEGNGTISHLAGETTLTADSSGFTGTTSILGGTLVVNGVLGDATSMLTLAAGSTLAGTGTIGGNASIAGTLSPGASVGTLSVGGDLVFDAGSTLLVELGSSGASADRIDVTGAATLAGALALAGTYEVSNSYTILSASGGLTGAFDTLSTDRALAFIEPVLDYSGTDVKLTLERNDVTFSQMAETPNQRALADSLESLGVGNEVHDAIVRLDADGAREAYDALSGDIHSGTMTGIVRDGQYIHDSVLGHLSGVFGPSGVGGAPVQVVDSSAPTLAELGVLAAEPTYAFWSRSFGSWGHNDGDGNAAGFDRNTIGFLIGVDAWVAEDARIGAVAGYRQSTYTTDSQPSSSDVQGFDLGIYGDLDVSGFSLRAGAALGWQSIDTERTVAFTGFGETLTGTTDATSWQLFGEVGYPIDAGAVVFEPFANIAYVSVNSDGYTETGGASAMSIGDNVTDIVTTTLGSRLSFILPEEWLSMEVAGQVGWRHAAGDLFSETTAAFVGGGDTFTVRSAPTAEDAAIVGASLDVPLSAAGSLMLAYDGIYGVGVSDSTVTGGFRVRF